MSNPLHDKPLIDQYFRTIPDGMGRSQPAIYPARLKETSKRPHHLIR